MVTTNSLNNSSSSFTVDNIFLDGNTMSTLDTNGNLILSPNGTGQVQVTTSLKVDNLTLDANTISSTNTNGAIILSPNGSGTVQIPYGTQFRIPVFGASGAISQLASVGTVGQVLTSNGSANPTFQDVPSGGFTSIVIRVFDSSTTYTPTSGMVFCIIECVGGGGGGGGVVGPSGASNARVSGGGGGGGYARSVFSAATIGASKSITIGAGGSGGNAAGTDGSNGGASSVASIGISANGGIGSAGWSSGSAGAVEGSTGQGGAGGTATGQVTCRGFRGEMGVTSGNIGYGGAGSASFFGGGVGGNITNTDGANAVSRGAGGSGCGNFNNANGRSGGDGLGGRVVITEFIA